jgi:DNA repair protein RadA/Sms
MPIENKSCFTGEVGLSGEIRAVNKIDQRIAEADKLGYHKIYISAFNRKGFNPKNYQIEIITVRKVEELFNYLFA